MSYEYRKTKTHCFNNEKYCVGPGEELQMSWKKLATF